MTQLQPRGRRGESRDRDREEPFEEQQVEKVMRVMRSCTGLCRGGRDSLGIPVSPEPVPCWAPAPSHPKVPAGLSPPKPVSRCTWAPAPSHSKVPAGLSPPETVLCWAPATHTQGSQQLRDPPSQCHTALGTSSLPHQGSQWSLVPQASAVLGTSPLPARGPSTFVTS